MKILNIVGARPNFMKIAPLMAAMSRHPNVQPVLVHTGQHYDKNMSDVFFQDLDIPQPNIFLNVGSDTHAKQTAKIMMTFEDVVLAEKPDVILTVGDVNSTIACSLVGSKLGVKVAHVEAGLRSWDRTMPEEINRILTDAISDYLFTTSTEADENLKHEGIDPAKIHFVGNTMIDTLLKYRSAAEPMECFREFEMERKKYALLTLHRPSNVDDYDTLDGILRAIGDIQWKIPILFPIHPRTIKRLDEFGIDDQFRMTPHLHFIKPQSYLRFLSLMMDSRFVLTDSGGLQEETTVLGVPCLTLRENTERPITITMGTNELVGTKTENIIQAAQKILGGDWKIGSIPPLWDGRAAERIVGILASQQ